MASQPVQHVSIAGLGYARSPSIKYLESRALEFGTTRYKIVLEAILFSALGDACARSTRLNTVKNMHFSVNFFSKFFIICLELLRIDSRIVFSVKKRSRQIFLKFKMSS